MNENRTEGSEIKSWRDLIVWQKSHRLVLDIYRLTAGFPRDERYRLTDQLCRAAASVPTNIAEGKGRYSSALDHLNRRHHSVKEPSPQPSPGGRGGRTATASFGPGARVYPGRYLFRYFNKVPGNGEIVCALLMALKKRP